MLKNANILIVAGEASGDQHGAHLLKELSLLNKDLSFFAMGHTHLAQSGATMIVDSKELAIMGIIEIFSKLTVIRKAFRKITAAIKIHRPDAVVLIDYSGFNLRLAKKIKKTDPNVKIIYYISPQIWAWRYHRIKSIKKYVDLMAVIYPFEVPIYKKEKVPVKFVGNPLSDQVKTTLLSSQRRDFFALKTESIVIGLLPGSRPNEIKHLLPTILEAATMLSHRHQNIEFILPLANTFTPEQLTPYLTSLPYEVKITQSHSYDAMSVCDVIIVTSGTATLEVAMLAKPMVILYKSSAINMFLARLLVKGISHIGMCNIVAQNCIVQELLQEDVTAENIVAEVEHILTDDDYRNTMIANLQKVGQTLQREARDENLANLIVQMIAK